MRLSIEIEENDYALYDYNLVVDGAQHSEGFNYTSEQAAIDAAQSDALRRWWNP